MRIAQLLGVMDVGIHASFEGSNCYDLQIVMLWNLQNSGTCRSYMTINFGPTRPRELFPVMHYPNITNSININEKAKWRKFKVSGNVYELQQHNKI
jgi:hypothetical protein